MTDNRGFRVSWLITLAILLATLSIAMGDRVFSHWAYSLERGRIQAAADELADAGRVSNAFRLVAKIARPGVVHISVSGGNFRHKGSDEGDDRNRYSPLPSASGSGFLIDDEGHILTNSHVVAGREQFTVRLSDDRVFPASLIGTDPKSDLAVLKIDAPDLHPLMFGDSDTAEVGDWVLAVGAPFGLRQSVTHGIISAKGRSEIRGVDIHYQDFIQTDASINPGNSGGPLLNLKGEVIGINTAIATNGDIYNAGIAFTIPSNMARKIAEELKKNGEVTRGWLGISMSELTEHDHDTLRTRKKNGVMVDIVFEDTPAYRAELTAEDVILSINGTSVDNIPQIKALIANIMPGDPATFRVWRDEAERTIRVRLARQPRDIRSRASLPLVSRPIKQLGFQARSLRSDLPLTLMRYGYRDLGLRTRNILSEHGVLVVDELSRNSLDGVDLVPGDVVIECNGKTVQSVSDLKLALNSTESRRSVKLRVLGPDGGKRIVYLKRATK